MQRFGPRIAGEGEDVGRPPLVDPAEPIEGGIQIPEPGVEKASIEPVVGVQRVGQLESCLSARRIAGAEVGDREVVERSRVAGKSMPSGLVCG